METRNLEKTAAEASSEEIQPLTLTRKTGKSCTYLYIKRLQDIVLSALALLLLSPLMLLLALAVVIDDPKGGPIFSQVRCGRGGEAFRLYKCRTMCVDAEKRLEKLLPYNEMTGRHLNSKMTRGSPAWGGFCGLQGWTSCPSWSTS